MIKSFYAFLIFFVIIQISFQNEEIDEVININTEQEQEYSIKSNTSYIFTIENDSYVYSFISYINNIFYLKNGNDSFEVRPNETFFEKGEKIYVNHLKTLNDTKIKIIPFLIHTKFNSFQTIKENQYFLSEQKINQLHILILLIKIQKFIFQNQDKKMLLKMI